jgi:protein-disulfide isomerase/uncharacterized membrane protein
MQEEVIGSQRSRGAAGLAVSLVPALAGLVASAMLLVDYLRPKPVFCAEGGGCEALRNTAFAAPLGLPLPFFGVGGFLLIGLVALLPGRRARVAQLALCLAGGALGAALLTVQALLRTWCPYCSVADASAVASAVVAGLRLWRAPGAFAPPPLSYAGAASLLLALLGPLYVGFRATPVPRVIRDELRQTPRREVTVVDFVDFECPFCRLTHGALQPLVARHRDRIRLVRRQVPLSIHPHAKDAARAACCGDVLGKGEAMAEALFSAPVEELTAEGCERLARTAGLPVDAYRACVVNPATDARIDADRAEFKAAGGFALPTLWIDRTEFVGAQPPETLERAIDEALARAGS